MRFLCKRDCIFYVCSCLHSYMYKCWNQLVFTWCSDLIRRSGLGPFLSDSSLIQFSSDQRGGRHSQFDREDLYKCFYCSQPKKPLTDV